MKKIFINLTLILSILLVPSAPLAYAQESPFSDLPTDHPSFETVMTLVELGIVEGYSDGTVRPDQNITRAELMKIIVEGMGITPHPMEYNRCFTDVTIISEWYIGYVCYGKEEGWVVGYPDGTFQPGNNINNIEILSMIFNAYNLPMLAESEIFTPFDDVPADAWYTPYMQYAVKNMIIDVDNNYYNPGEIITRIEAFEILGRTLAQIEVK